MAKLISSLMWMLPQSIKWNMAVFLAWLWFDVFRLRRYTVLKNISIVFPDIDKSQKMALARSSMRHLCYHLFEFFLLPRMTADWVKNNVIIEGIEHFHQAQKHDKGVLLLSLHVGNGDMGVAVMSLAGIPVALISKKFKNQFLNQIWFGIRESVGSEFIDPHGTRTAFEILAKLKKNHGVVFVIDQFMSKPYGIETTFFGRKTGTAHGLAVFAAKAGAPVVPVYTYRDSQLRTHLVFEEPVEFVANPDKDLQTLHMTQKFNDRLEKIILRHPDQWMWVHRRWKVWG